MKNSIETIGNRIRDLLVYSEVPQPTAPPRAFFHISNALLSTIIQSRQYVLGYWQHSSAVITGNVSTISGTVFFFFFRSPFPMTTAVVCSVLLNKSVLADLLRRLFVVEENRPS
jgi:hypothetical protein